MNCYANVCTIHLTALAAFIAASYTEDTYGQAQQVIPATLEAMAKYHDELVAYRAEFLMTAERRGEVWREEATKAWKEEAEPIQKSELEVHFV